MISYKSRRRPGGYDLYKTPDNVCAYCGMPADHKDHVPPISKHDVFEGYSKWLIPSCAECNLTLSGRPYPTIKERQQYLIRKYKERFKTVLKTPDWSELELNELDKDFRSYIEASLKLKDNIKYRLYQLTLRPSLLIDR